jgi:glycosyltransferase involved in cell wall biosynthesis
MFGVVPSVWPETFGNVVTEAMSRGRPVVASRLGGIVDIIEDGASGLLVPAADEEALAAAMQRLLDDDGLRSDLGTAARERVERFAASRVIPQFEALYRELLSRRGPAGAREHAEGSHGSS